MLSPCTNSVSYTHLDVYKRQDPTYAAMFVQDGVFWHLLAYCAGVGGSLLIIGSAAGVVAMGLENINFVWYFKKISLMAFVGYLAGIGVCMLEVFLFGI